MNINFEEHKVNDLELKVRAILGVPEEILTDEIISSPIFLSKADKYINRYIKDYENLDIILIDIAYVYYISYLLCPGMYSRLPKQMENVSTKTILQSMDWDKIALDMLDKCNETLDEAIEEEEEEGIDFSNSFAVLSDSSEYPNSNI